MPNLRQGTAVSLQRTGRSTVNDDVREALQELVACKDLADDIEHFEAAPGEAP